MTGPFPPSTSLRLGCLGSVIRKPLAIGAILTALCFGATAIAQDFEVGVEHAILVDYETGTVLFEHNADLPMPPASLAKLMTMYLVFEALRDDRLSLDDAFVVSENAWRKGGAPSGTSTMFAELGSSITVSNLMRGVIIQSGNDAAITIAEGMAGSEEAFADQMNEAAGRLGLSDSVFTNPTGLPDAAQYVTARDLSILAAAIIREFPEHYAIYSEREFTWNGITQSNRNTLLRMDIGADGMKTGFTEESGYGLIASAVRGERRLIAVINGAESEGDRTSEAADLLEWGFEAFTRVSLFRPAAMLAEAEIFGGTEPTVGLVMTTPLNVLVPNEATGRLAAEIIYRGPLIAPVLAGDIVGTLRLLLDGQEIATSPIVTAAAVGRGTLPQRAGDALADLVFGWQ